MASSDSSSNEEAVGATEALPGMADALPGPDAETLPRAEEAPPGHGAADDVVAGAADGAIDGAAVEAGKIFSMISTKLHLF